VRDGDWKLVEWYEDGAVELYNVRKDLAEQKNLALSQPDVARRLQAELAEWRKQVKAVMPAKNPDFDKESDGRKPKNLERTQN